MRKWVAFGVLTVALTIAAWWWWSQPMPPVQILPANSDNEVAELIERLREPNNKVQYGGTIIPGGEVLSFSTPMTELISMGQRARAALHERIGDVQIQNEVVLVLGAIGDLTTVPLLIDAYPEDDVKNCDANDPKWMKTICFTFALTYLTGQPIGRSRWGADCNPKNRELWQQWWRQRDASYVIPAEKPRSTWVPYYPVQ